MLSDKQTKKFRGVAFVELADKQSLTKALARHQSRLGHKKINVELSSGALPYVFVWRACMHTQAPAHAGAASGPQRLQTYIR